MSRLAAAILLVCVLGAPPTHAADLSITLGADERTFTHDFRPN